MDTTKLIELAKFLKILRKSLLNDNFCFADFVIKEMCVLNEAYYIKITDDAIEIRIESKELMLSKDFYYYESLKSLLEDIYYIRDFKKRKIQKRIDFLLKRIMKEYIKSIEKVEEFDFDYEDLDVVL